MQKVTWILDFDYDFTAPKQISEFLNHFIVLPEKSLITDWPKVQYPCVTYGTMRKVSQLLQQKSLCEAVFDDYISLRCSYYYRKVYKFLKRMAFIVPFSSLEYIDWYKIFSQQIFIRPDSNHKPFEAQIVSIDNIPDFIRKYQHSQHNELVVVSEVVRLGQEYRCFCRNGKVFCHSSYPDPYHPAPKDVIVFAEKIAQILSETISSNMLTIDIAKNDCLRLVEIGGVNSWGIYGGNIQDFIYHMEQEAIERQSFLLTS